jgi:hypothetical protein
VQVTAFEISVVQVVVPKVHGSATPLPQSNITVNSVPQTPAFTRVLKSGQASRQPWESIPGHPAALLQKEVQSWRKVLLLPPDVPPLLPPDVPPLLPPDVPPLLPPEVPPLPPLPNVPPLPWPEAPLSESSSSSELFLPEHAAIRPRALHKSSDAEKSRRDEG